MKWLSRWWMFTAMVAPAFIVYTVYMVYPVFYSLYYSFTNYDGVAPAKWVGTQNYRTMADDTVFWTSLKNTATILAIAVFILIPLAFFLALLMSGPVRGTALMRPLIFAPAIVAPILVGLIWIFILDPKIGLVNAFLRAIGIPGQPQWIGGTTLSPYSIAMVYLWEQIGFVLTIFYAGIRMLPRDVMEASMIDGASRSQQLRYVTVPMLQETFGICTALVITGVFKIFELVYELTGGGPVHLSDVLVSYMYYVTFQTLQYSYGMALAVVICVLGALGSLAALGLLRRRATA
jgi:raffinose/stachyose/melibiose transport system permease protein